MPLRIVADTAFGGPTRRTDLLTKQFPVVDGDGHHGGVGSLRAGNGLDDGTKTPAVGRHSRKPSRSSRLGSRGIRGGVPLNLVSSRWWTNWPN